MLASLLQEIDSPFPLLAVIAAIVGICFVVGAIRDTAISLFENSFAESEYEGDEEDSRIEKCGSLSAPSPSDKDESKS